MSKVVKVSYINQLTLVEHSHDELSTLELMCQTAEDNEMVAHIKNMFGFEDDKPKQDK